ncbi:repeat domain (List_Bact_rpt), partial [Oscillospiraceae bacterium]
MRMKTRKLLALMVSASMTFNLLGYAAGDIVSADETEEVITEEAPENTEETDSIPEGSDIAEDDIKPDEEVELTEETTEEVVEEIPEEIAEAIVSAPFNQEAEVDGVIVSVIADEGVFPEGAYMSVERVENTENSDVLIEETLDDDVNIICTMTFDITIYDSEGNEIEPDTEAGSVYVSFTDSLVADSNLDVDIYHITDEDEAIALDVNVEDELVVAETDGFSYYTLVFSRNSLSYELEGDTTVPLSNILDAVGLSGTVSSVTSSNTTLVSAEQTNGVWYVTSHRTFTNNSTTLTVTIGSTDYPISITPQNTFSQNSRNDYIAYGISLVSYSNAPTDYPGFNVYGLTSSGSQILTTYNSRGYRTVMQVGDGNLVNFENFAYGKPYSSDGVESYITAEIQGQAVYVTYHITNNNTTDSQVQIGTYGDVKIGTDDHAIMTPNGNGLTMVSGKPADNGARFYLLPGGASFDALWVGCSGTGGITNSYMQAHVFDNSIATNDGTQDSAVAWSWNVNVPAGQTVTRVAILAVTPDVQTKTVTLNLNDESGSTQSVITIGDMGLILPVNEEERDGYEFSGWSTDPDSTVAEYADGATVPIEDITDDFQLYGVWTPEGATLNADSYPTAVVDAEFTGNNIALANAPSSVNVPAGYTVKYSLSENGPWSDTPPMASHAGDYTVYYMFDGVDDNHADITDTSYHFTSNIVATAPSNSQKPAANNGAYVEGGRPLVTAPSTSN